MPEYRRIRVEGGTYFFTVVTYQRKPILTSEISRKILHDAWMDVKHRFPFETIGICLMPDHLHCIWKLPEGDSNYSVRWKEIKRLFSKQYAMQIGSGEPRNVSHQIRNEAAIWQRRFWEHTILDADDLDTHLDYIHYNPIKHGLTTRAADWPWSSFKRIVTDGFYDLDWIGDDTGRLKGIDWD